jgi:hypothetical protein
VPQDRDVGVRHLFDGLAHFEHLRVVPEETQNLGLGLHAAAQLLHLFLQRVGFEGLLEGQLEFFHLEGLAQEVGGPAAHGLDDGARLSVSREHDHGHVRHALLQLTQRLETVDARQHDVERDHVGTRLVERLECLLSVADAVHVVPMASRERLEVLADARVVVDHQDSERFSHGSPPAVSETAAAPPSCGRAESCIGVSG